MLPPRPRCAPIRHRRQVTVLAGAGGRIHARVSGEEGADQPRDERPPRPPAARPGVRPASARRAAYAAAAAASAATPQKRTSRIVTLTVASPTTSSPSAPR